MDLAAVYSREIGDQVLTFGASGWTYAFTFILYDHQTESLWYHLRGTDGMTCISGAFADTFLPELNAVKLRWTDWARNHPDSKYWRHWP